MSVDMSGLTAAWLGAVVRSQAKPTLLPERPSVEQNTLTDVIEGALRTGGLDSKDPDWVDPLAPGQLVDRNV
ncbi:MAG: hypothetical protein JWN71_459 [Xanthobacteraceae bacterium]|jgi:hypothetical protein|nr:hypothetical protein [Xanthobacteraceae bacterium]